MYLPTMAETPRTRIITTTFRGYNHNLKTEDGDWYEEYNLGSESYPLLAKRLPTTVVEGTLTNPQGASSRGTLLVVDNGLLYSITDGHKYSVPLPTGITLASTGRKQIVSMGAYAVIFPDGVYVNTEDLSDIGTLDHSFQAGSTSTAQDVVFTTCKADGTDYDMTDCPVSDTEPSDPQNGTLWIDSSGSIHVLRQYSAATETWNAVPTTFVKIACPNIGKGFSEYDGVDLSGVTGDVAGLEDLKGNMILYGSGNDYIIVAGLIDQSFTQSSGGGDPIIRVQRQMPIMDFVCECNNRIWGCRYGLNRAGDVVNEIYACKLGDFRNWFCYMGLSSDSYAASIGTDGVWTGCINHLGNPLFFKEDHLHKVSGSMPSNFQITTTICRGVQEGSSESLVTVNETLFYKSRKDVCCYDGSLPTGISEALGPVQYHNAIAGTMDGRYYIAMKDPAEHWFMFVYDTRYGIWHRQDPFQPLFFLNHKGKLLEFVTANQGAQNYIIDLTGTEGSTAYGGDTWSCETGIITYETTGSGAATIMHGLETKYLGRFNIRARFPAGSSMRIALEYDSSGVWEWQGPSYSPGTGGTTRLVDIPVRPRRCDHLRMKISAAGDIRIFSITRILEEGSDVE